MLSILRVAIAGAALSALGFSGLSIASAADLYEPPAAPSVYNPAPAADWTGIYVGAVGGYGWGSSNATLAGPNIFGNGVDMDLHGGLIGGTLGYNWQHGVWVLGVEGDISGGNLAGTANTTAFPATMGSYELNWLATLRGRLGWTTMAMGNPMLLYLTGGVAWGGADRHIQNSFNTPAVSTSATHTGWTIGAGAEYAITNNWSVKAEYLYTDLGSANYVGGFGGGGATQITSVDLTSHLVRLGVNYKF